MDKVKVQIINTRKDFDLPSYATPQSAGLDLRADLSSGVKVLKAAVTQEITTRWNPDTKEITLYPGERCIIPTGLYIALPEGYEAQLRPRSGLAIKQGISLVNTPGTIDADYRGEIGVIIINFNTEPVIIKDGDKICQMVIKRYEQAEFIEVDSLDDTERGSGGFGHTGA